jgi:hypothetical protein
MVGKISHELARYEIDLLLIADDERLADTCVPGPEPAGRCADRRAYSDDDPALTQLSPPVFLPRPWPQPAAGPMPGLILIIRPEPGVQPAI